MRKQILFHFLLFFFFSIAFVLSGCLKKNDPIVNSLDPESTWNIERDGIPKFVTTNYIELDKISQISKFRSSFGHDYSDSFEHCRSMKHYFEPLSSVNWSSVKIYSPVTGKIVSVYEEWAGTKIEIIPDQYPMFRFSIFHLSPLVKLNVDDKVVAGQQLGNHIGVQTMSDISVMVTDSTNRMRLVSYFEVMTDSLFNEYFKLGVNTRERMLISKEVRDANPLTCNGDSFISSDTLENWVILHR